MIILISTLRPEPHLSKSNIEKLPYYIAGYHAKKLILSKKILNALSPDIHIYRCYYSPQKMRIYLYLFYYSTKKGGRTGHNPYACLPGAGWEIVKHSYKRIYYKDKYERINLIFAKRGLSKILMLHWYQAKDRIFATGVEQNIFRLLNKLLHNKNDGVYVELITKVTLMDMKKKELSMLRFAKELIPLISIYWPEEK